MADNSQTEKAPPGSVQPAGSGTGWWNPTPYSNRRRVVFHYVAADGRTLCGKWLYVGIGTLEEGQDDHSDNCAACRRKKLALNEKSPNK